MWKTLLMGLILICACQQSPAVQRHIADSIAWDESSWRDLSTVECHGKTAFLIALSGKKPVIKGPLPSLRVTYGCGFDDEGRFTVSVALAAHVAHLNQPAEIYEGLAQLEFDADLAGKGWQKLALTTAAFSDALDVAFARMQMAQGDEKLVVNSLASLDVNRQILLAAIETAGDLKIKDAVPGLIKLLDSKDPQLVLRTIGSLGRLGDQRALPALGSLGVSPIPVVWHTALQAIADIGGNDAIKALELVANQSTSPNVSKVALELMEQVRSGKTK